MDINAFLNNNQNMYFGHGTGSKSEVIQSILNNGLRCSHGSLYFTSISLGIGSQIADSEQELLRNWPHLDSKIIVIVSLPIKYRTLDVVGLGIEGNGDAAFYYIPAENLRNKYIELTNSPYVMPEFIAGYYNSQNDSYTPNPKYYENLSMQEQESLFIKVKENYFNVVTDAVDIEQYKEILKIVGCEFPLSDDEINTFQQKKKIVELFSQIPPAILNKKLILPDGNTITAEKYIKEIVLPYFPIRDFVYLKTGAQIPFLHFLMECVIFDCQERYKGDFTSYINDNVKVANNLLNKK
ncbi:MAG: hypothetical protein E7163_04925 [Firmicutes bacterium]|nr:hypothetical protein [Bacillota bacterium]